MLVASLCPSDAHHWTGLPFDHPGGHLSERLHLIPKNALGWGGYPFLSGGDGQGIRQGWAGQARVAGPAGEHGTGSDHGLISGGVPAVGLRAMCSRGPGMGRGSRSGRTVRRCGGLMRSRGSRGLAIALMRRRCTGS